MAKCIEHEMYRVGRFSGCGSVTPGHAVEPSGFSLSPEHSPLPRPRGAPPSPQPPLQLRTPGASREWNHVGLVLLCPVTEHDGLWTQPGWSGRQDFLPAQAEQPQAPRTAPCGPAHRPAHTWLLQLGRPSLRQRLLLRLCRRRQPAGEPVLGVHDSFPFPFCFTFSCRPD